MSCKVGVGDGYPVDDPDFWNAGEGDLDDEDDDDDDDDNLGNNPIGKNTGEDEYFDGSRACHDTEFECHSDHVCIPLDQFCDNVKDCDDGSDETKCATTPSIPYSNTTEGTHHDEGEHHAKTLYVYYEMAGARWKDIQLNKPSKN